MVVLCGATEMSKAIVEKIKSLLDSRRIQYTVFEHEPVRTSEEAARVRERLTGMPASEILKRGAKAMIVRSNGRFFQFVLSAARRIDFKKIKQIVGSSSASLASPEEVLKATDCVPGSVPPFGNLFGMPVYVDSSLLSVEEIDFNAGEQTVSIVMKLKDWLAIVNPVHSEFSVP